MATRRENLPITLNVGHPDYKLMKRFMTCSTSTRMFLLDNTHPVYQFFTAAGSDVEEWIELAIENWLTAEGRHCAPDTVEEFKANMGAVLDLVRKLHENIIKYPQPYASRRKSRFVKR